MNALRLLFSDTLRRDRIRLVCAIVGIAAASALLAWTLGLAVTTWYQGQPLSEAMGRPYDCWVSTGRASAAAPKGSGMQTLAHGSPFKMIPLPVVNAVQTSPDVASLTCTTVFRCRLDWRPEGRPVQGPGYGGGIAPVRDFPQGCPYPEGLAAGRWPRAEAVEPEFVISPFGFGVEGLAVCPPVGTRVPVVTPRGRVEAVICGYLSEQTRPVSGFPTMFASNTLADAAALSETAGRTNLILIQLKAHGSAAALIETVRTISPDDDAAKLVTRTDVLHQLRSDAISNLSRQVPLLVILACVATLCMMIDALCIGIEQNRLRYARLRAIGMTAAQLRRLISMEGAFIAGVGGIIGFLVGGGILTLWVRSQPLIFPDGVHLMWVTPVGTAFLIALSTFAALMVPLRRIARQTPCELRPAPTGWQSKQMSVRTMVAVLCLCPILLTLVRFSANPLLRSLWFLLVGLPLCITGLILLAKPLLAFCDCVLVRPVGALLRLNPTLLRGTLCRSADRNARMVLTLTVGLGGFIAIHLWGNSLTSPFIPSLDFPVAIVSLLPDGITEETLARADAALLPFSAEQYRLHEDDFNVLSQRAGAQPKQNNILLIATPGATGVSVTEMFAQQCQMKVGDSFRIQRKEKSGAVITLPLTITKIVRCNWHLVTARAQMRGRNGSPFATLGPVFISAEVAKAWDPERHQRIRFLSVKELPATTPLALYSAAERLETKLQRLADAAPETSMLSASARGGKSVSAVPNVVVHLRDEISEGTLTHSAELVGALARIPLGSLLILCFGFVSLLSANVRAMAAELRTLHAIGMTRGQMGRFLLAQVLMLCAVASVLSLLFGLTVGWSFTGWTLAWMPFGGLPTTLVFPWAQIGQGVAVLFAATLLITPIPIVLLLRHLLKR
ncbi:MAG: FtsX-like permease family protein [Kiritimatiellia bacterium]